MVLVYRIANLPPSPGPPPNIPLPALPLEALQARRIAETKVMAIQTLQQTPAMSVLCLHPVEQDHSSAVSIATQ